MSEPLTITVPQPGPWVSMNDRPAHWAQRNGPAQTWRAAAFVACRGLAPLTPPVVIDAVVHKSRNGRWDAHNLMATVKHAIDGVVDAGLLPDDSNAYLTRVSIEAGAKSASPNLTLTITEITTEGGESRA